MGNLHITLVFMVILALFVGGVSAADTAEAAASKVSVTGVTMNPGVFYQWDTGTITVEVTNSGTESVVIRRATLSDNNIDVMQSAYETVGSVGGGGNKMQFTFTVKADAPEGIYYPIFSLEFRDAGSLRYPVTTKIQNADLQVSIQDKPDAFVKGKKDTVQLLIGNPRENAITGLTITPVGAGIDSIPTSYFIGNLPSGNSSTISFSVTPRESTTLTFNVDYLNGINKHSTSISFPVTLSEGTKKQADPVVSNIVQKPEGGIYRISGDVTNGGLETAKSVSVTVGSPAVPVDPYKTYVIGSLDPDDFSSFEVTFKAEDITSVPVLVTFKDADGNTYTRETLVDLTRTSSSARGTGSDTGFPVIPVLIVGIIAVAVGGIVLYSWRKGRNE